MKRITIISAVSALFCLLSSSCSTMKVATDVIKLYPMTCLIDEVKVYEGDKSPANYDHLGTVAVYDQGMTRYTSYEDALNLAKRAVCETGGNALYISRHEAPNSLASANHQFIGQMLFDTGDKAASNNGPASAIAVKKELPDYVDDHYRVAEGPQVINGNNIYVNVGYGRLVNDAQLDESVTIDRGTLENGLSYNFGYEHILPGGEWGLGLFCSNFTTSFNATITSSTATSATNQSKFDGNYRINFHTAGPSASRSFTDDHFFLTARIGLGLSWQNESFAFSDLVYGTGIDYESGVSKSDTYFGVGTHICAEFGYRVTSILTFGLTLGTTYHVIWYGSDSSITSSVANIAFINPTLRITL